MRRDKGVEVLEYTTKNVSSFSKGSTLESRKELRRRRELRKQRRRLKRTIFFLTVILTTCLCITPFVLNEKMTESPDCVDTINTSDTKVAAEITATPTPIEISTPTSVPKISADEKSFQEIYFYEPDKLERYKAYSVKHPDMSISDVVWRVNSHLDKPWYSEEIPVNGYDDYCIMVNKYYKVPDGYKPPDLTTVDNQLMRKVTADAFLKMRSDAKNQGLKISAVSAYRSVEYQSGLYNSYLGEDSKENVDRYSARPGHSEHHTGLALDLFGSVSGLRSFVNTPEYIWVRDNCYKYGFIIRYQADIENITGYEDEPWHIRYVGSEVSTDMKNKGIKSFEEYYVKYIKHKN